MQLPPPLRRGIEQELANANPARLRSASAALSACYREVDGTMQSAAGAFATADQRSAYLAVRVPATFAAIMAAVQWTRETIHDEVHSVLDLGSGPGTALWAACEVFPEIELATALERDSKLISIARRLGSQAERSALRECTWFQGDLPAAIPEGAWDLVVCSYALNELPEMQRAELVARAWERTRKLLVVVEPGTKAGYANILAVRSQMLGEGANIAAPCPNALSCPMAGTNDWCHFAARVERTAEHRRLKDASLGHEDEKFSYIALARADAHRPAARIVRHPNIFSGYTQLTLCRDGEIARRTVTRSQKEDWRRLKRLGWGTGW